jgi:acyl-CoA synthetase (AMP-forming)/AMP-acid ligase II
MEQKKLLNIIENGCKILTSGTTGTPKTYFQSPEKIRAANRVAIDSQKITKNSKVYTVSKMTHAGGLLAQTLPALSIGANVVIDNFNAYTFLKEIKKYTHTHLAPGHARAIMGTKGFKDCDLSNVWITCGRLLQFLYN